jgi:hypothetical protein
MSFSSGRIQHLFEDGSEAPHFMTVPPTHQTPHTPTKPRDPPNLATGQELAATGATGIETHELAATAATGRETQELAATAATGRETQELAATAATGRET